MAWIARYEVYSICRHCHAGTIFVVELNDYTRKDYLSEDNSLYKYGGSINDFMNEIGYINITNNNIFSPPEHVPETIDTVFREASTCASVECWNAAGSMFRSAIDLATKTLLPAEDEEPNNRIRRSLGLRLEWLFDNNRLPAELKDLAECIQQDGNDGAHDGTLTEADVSDLKDFAYELLERLYTYPKRLEIARERRDLRRNS
ncbi:DUF4145 domain-containing protein [Breoghania sp. L-A4]|uniref:DUF4145 domain-containing protein n=1 Tax=Breoghania sp. L-A4 TaxID=2304600 RepID=UPI00196881D5|nr:DUF4145 domain-containing protein [Breoghania sp. L-A4]